MKIWCYTVQHIEGEFLSDDIRYHQPGWRDNKFKDISTIRFWLPENRSVFLYGMNQYNLFIEAIQDIGGKSEQTAVYVLGSYDNIVYGFIIGNGEIKKIKCELGKEYNNTPSNGWKPGVKSNYYGAVVI